MSQEKKVLLRRMMKLTNLTCHLFPSRSKWFGINANFANISENENEQFLKGC